jgi:Glycosyltransferase family 10 (fucosyltransferase) C-term
MYATLSNYTYFVYMDKEHFSDVTHRVFPNAAAYCKDIVSYLNDIPKPLTIIHISEFDQSLLDSRPTVLISGEPDPIPHQVALVIAPFCEQPQPSVFFPFLYMSLGERYLHTYPVKEKNKMCAFMYRQSYKHRDEIFYRFNQFFRVDALGLACKNVETPSTRHINNEQETYNDIAVKTYASYYFVLAIENTWKEGYFTEKLINPIIAHSIPIYWGHPKVFEYINKKRVIYMPDYESDQQLVDKLMELKNNPVLYNAIMSEPCYTSYGEPKRVVEEFKKEIQAKLT